MLNVCTSEKTWIIFYQASHLEQFIIYIDSLAVVKSMCRGRGKGGKHHKTKSALNQREVKY